MLKLFNTLSRKKEIFAPLRRARRGKKGKFNQINLFVCGPTVYDFSHLGHAKTYIFFDMAVKYLRQAGFNVFYLQNITDIDDKIIKMAREKKTTTQKLAKNFEKEYLKDMKLLNINSVTKYARATDHINKIISQIKRLLRKGYGYKINDGIYYNIAKFKNYGKLAKRTIEQAEDGVSRIDESKNKKNKGDFCLWKYVKKPSKYEPFWKTPFGEGRPGWHIEDTAITETYFGPQYDIHGGGMDLIFPHHEAEIAQMEAISGKKPLAKYWIHTGFLTVKGEKMAKSLGNFITIRDFLKKYNPRILRFFFLKNHYRSPIDYSEKGIDQTKRDLERIDEFIDKLKELKKKKINIKNSSPLPMRFKGGGLDAGRNAKDLILKIEKEFNKAMDNDFNAPIALASVFHLVNRGNWLLDRNGLTSRDAIAILKTLRKIDKVFGFIFYQREKEKISGNILKLAKEREEYRKKGMWHKADEIRKKVEKLGYWIEDTKEGPKIKFNRNR